MKIPQQHFFKPPFATALKEVLRKGYTKKDLRADVLSGLTLGIIAVPLSMALAIASGVPPSHGIYTAIVAGAIIALAGGSRLSVSGPTAAFVVILHPIAVKFGIGGLLVATMLAGIILLIMGLGRMGKLIEFIPDPVTTGFTSGIGLVIATLQIKDFLGLQVEHSPEHYIERVIALLHALPTINPADCLIGSITLIILIGWPRLRTAIPSHLVALFFAALLAWILAKTIPGFTVETIASRFTYEVDGIIHHGIPPFPPSFSLPWLFPGADGQPLEFSFGLLRELIGPAFSIAILGAIESLLCAVVVDSMARTEHDPNAELIGQGLGNFIAPFFGGIAATGAIARSATNVRSGGKSPFAAFIHALVLLIIIVSFAPLLGMLPMSALAALLFVVAWNMSDIKNFKRILKIAPREDLIVLLTCFGLTVIFDMTVSVTAGIVLAALLFMHRMADATTTTLLQDHTHHPALKAPLPEHVRLYEMAGSLFFGAAKKALGILRIFDPKVDTIIIDMDNVAAIDVTGIMELEGIIEELNAQQVYVILADVQSQPLAALRKAGLKDIEGKFTICSTIEQAIAYIKHQT